MPAWAPASPASPPPPSKRPCGPPAACEVASDALQLHGGYGLAKEMLIEKLFRDARASMIEDGTNEVLSLAGARRIIDTDQATPLATPTGAAERSAPRA